MEREDPAAVSDPASGAGSQPGGAEAGCLELEMKKKKMARIHHPAASAKSFPPKASAPLVTLGRREKKKEEESSSNSYSSLGHLWQKEDETHKKRRDLFLQPLQLPQSPLTEERSRPKKNCVPPVAVKGRFFCCYISLLPQVTKEA